MQIGSRLLFGIALSLLLGTSCAKVATKCAAPPSADTSEILAPADPNVSVDIFLDATLSMQGFITANEASYYKRSIPILERSVIKNGGQVNFFAFGTDI